MRKLFIALMIFSTMVVSTSCGVENINTNSTSENSVVDAFTTEMSDDFKNLLDSYSANGYTIKGQHGENFDCVAYIENQNPDSSYSWKYKILVPETLNVLSRERLKQENLLYKITSESGNITEHDGYSTYFTQFSGYAVFDIYLSGDGHLNESLQGFLMKEDFENKNEKYISASYSEWYNSSGYVSNIYKVALGTNYDNISYQLAKIVDPEIIKN